MLLHRALEIPHGHLHGTTLVWCVATQPCKSLVQLKLNLTYFNIYVAQRSENLRKDILMLILLSFLNCLQKTYPDQKFTSELNFSLLQFSDLPFRFHSMISRYYCILHACIYDPENDKHQKLLTLSRCGLEVIIQRCCNAMTINSMLT